MRQISMGKEDAICIFESKTSSINEITKDAIYVFSIHIFNARGLHGSWTYRCYSLRSQRSHLLKRMVGCGGTSLLQEP